MMTPCTAPARRVRLVSNLSKFSARRRGVSKNALLAAAAAKGDTLLHPAAGWVEYRHGSHLRIPRDASKGSRFPARGGVSDFAALREGAYCFVDKTGYIPLLSGKKERVKLLCRPRGFGKSLTLSMLRYFHGFEHRCRYERLFSGLDVDAHVVNGPLKPGRFLLMSFAFDQIPAARDLDEAATAFDAYVDKVVEDFALRYQEMGLELGWPGIRRDGDAAGNMRRVIEAASSCLQPINGANRQKNHPFYKTKGTFVTIDDYDHQAYPFLPHLADPHSQWEQSALTKAHARFYSKLHAMTRLPCGLKMVYMTGTLPLLVRAAINISRKPDCMEALGLNAEDVAAALEHRFAAARVCEKQQALQDLSALAGRHRFSPRDRDAEPALGAVFETAAVLRYLDDPRAPPAVPLVPSGVPPQLLALCAAHPKTAPHLHIAAAAKGPALHYRKSHLHEFLDLRQLTPATADAAVCRTLLLHAGFMGFHPDKAHQRLVVPNRLARARADVELFGKPMPSGWVSNDDEERDMKGERE